MTGRHQSSARAVILVTVLVLTFSACTSTPQDSADDSASTSSSSTTGDSATIRVMAADGGTVRVGGASLTIPAGSLDRDTDVRLSVAEADPADAATSSSAQTSAETSANVESTTGADPATASPEADAISAPPFFQAAGPMVSGDLGGAHLSQPATLLLPLSTPIADGTVVGYLDEQAGKWAALPSTVDTAAKAITTEVPHLSSYQPWAWDLDAVRSGLETTFASLAGAGVALRADPPQCQAAPSGVSVAVTGGRSGDPSLDGCIEDAGNGQVRLRVVNNRSYGMVVTPADGATLEKLSRGGTLAAFYQAKGFADVGGDYVPPGGDADYLLPAEGPMVSATGTWSWKTYTLDVAFGLWLTLAGRGASALSPIELVKVGKCLGDKVFSDPPTSVDGAIRTSIGCLGLLDKVWLAPLALLQGLLIDLAGAYDAGQDTGLGSPGVVTVTRPPVPSSTPAIDEGAVLAGYTRSWGRTGSLLQILPDRSGCMRAGNSAANRVTYQLSYSVDKDGTVLGTVNGTPEIVGTEDSTFGAGHVFRFHLEDGDQTMVSTNAYSDDLPDLSWEAVSVDSNDCGFGGASTASTVAPAAPAAKVIGPAGFGPLTIGMTVAEAQAADPSLTVTNGSGCTGAKTANSSALFNRDDGRISRIFTDDTGVSTAEGLSIGEPARDGIALYGEPRGGANATLVWPVPGSDVTYVVAFEAPRNPDGVWAYGTSPMGDGKVTSISLEHNQKCIN